LTSAPRPPFFPYTTLFRSAPRPLLKSLAGVDRALLRASNVEVIKLEKRVTFLATTAAIAPFIGLFGTVWGIIGAFQGIAQTGSRSEEHTSELQSLAYLVCR